MVFVKLMYLEIIKIKKLNREKILLLMILLLQLLIIQRNCMLILNNLQ